VAEILAEIYAAAAHFHLRLPELFCGFQRAAGEPPVAYPVACLPQAWAAGSVFMLLQAGLGLSIDGEGAEVEIRDPSLPSGIDRLSVGGLQVGDGTIDLTFERLDGRIAVHSNSRGPRLRVRYSQERP